MTTAFYTHPICIEHDPGAGHPERPERLASVVKALSGQKYAALDRREVAAADPETVELMHDGRYVAAILAAVPASGRRALDPDTWLSPASGEAALRAVGAVCAAVDAVAEGKVANAFCGLRPPGHHAERDRAMGFCLFNNVAIAARHAQKRHGAKRIAVVDFDVHHGNGTQHMFEPFPDLFYASSHQYPAYPGTGAASERGSYDNVVNVQLRPGAGTAQFRAAYSDVILPALRAFAPDFLLISAGFDAHARDPLCQLEVQTEDFRWLTRELAEVAQDCCDGRIVSVLEGGYDLQALSDSAQAHVGVLMSAG
jgi:acetoin utilization deacetylase AcuC-like enzyme